VVVETAGLAGETASDREIRLVDLVVEDIDSYSVIGRSGRLVAQVVDIGA
jgi:hypothetical protein